MRWQDGRLIIDINEVSGLPLISRMRGRVTLTPQAITSVELPLKADGSHVWRPFAPSCDIDVALEAPGWKWSGHGYFDANFGTAALEDDFSFWTWGRYPTASGATCIYDAALRDGTELNCAFHFDKDGGAHVIDAPPRTPFKRSLWQIRRETRADPGTTPRQVMAMLDAPFYARSVVKTRLNGEDVIGVHEALDLDRYASALVKPMLAFRVPRRSNWRFD